MKKEFYLVISLFFILFFKLSLFGQPFSVLKDIKPGSTGSTYFNFTNINGVFYSDPMMVSMGMNYGKHKGQKLTLPW